MAQGRNLIRGQGQPALGRSVALPYSAINAGRGGQPTTPQGSPLSQGPPFQSPLSQINVSPSLYVDEKLNTGNGILDVTFGLQNIAGKLKYVPIKINQNQSFAQPINITNNGLTTTGSANYTYSIQNNAIVANLVNTTGTVSYQPSNGNATVIGNLTGNGNIALIPGVTLGVPVNGTIGKNSNQYLGTVFYSPTQTNGNIGFNFSSFQATNVFITGKYQNSSVGYTIEAQTTFNPATNTVGLNLPNYGNGQPLPAFNLGSTILATPAISQSQATAFPGTGTYNFFLGTAPSSQAYTRTPSGVVAGVPGSVGLTLPAQPSPFLSTYISNPSFFQNELNILQAKGGGYYTYSLAPTGVGNTGSIVLPSNIFTVGQITAKPQYTLLIQPSINIGSLGLTSVSGTTITNYNLNTQQASISGTKVTYSITGSPSLPITGQNPISNAFYQGLTDLEKGGVTHYAPFTNQINQFLGVSTVQFNITQGSGALKTTSTFTEQLTPSQIIGQQQILGAQYSSNPTALQQVFKAGAGLGNIGYGLYSPFATTGQFEVAGATVLASGALVVVPEIITTASGFGAIGGGTGLILRGVINAPFGGLANVGFSEASSVISGGHLLEPTQIIPSFETGAALTYAGSQAGDLFFKPSTVFKSYEFIQATTNPETRLISVNVGQSVFSSTQPEEITDFIKATTNAGANADVLERFTYDLQTTGSASIVNIKAVFYKNVLSELSGNGQNLLYLGEGTGINAVGDIFKSQTPSITAGAFKFNLYSINANEELSLVATDIGVQQFSKSLSISGTSEQAKVEGLEIPEINAKSYTQGTEASTSQGFNINLNTNQNILATEQNTNIALGQVNIAGALESGSSLQYAELFESGKLLQQSIVYNPNAFETDELAKGFFFKEDAFINNNPVFGTYTLPNYNEVYRGQVLDITAPKFTGGNGATIINGLEGLEKNPIPGTLSYTSGSNQDVAFGLSEEKVFFEEQSNKFSNGLQSTYGRIFEVDKEGNIEGIAVQNNLPDIINTNGKIGNGINTGRSIFDITSNKDTFSAVTFSYQQTATFSQSVGFETEAGEFKIGLSEDVQGIRTIGKATIEGQEKPLDITGFTFKAEPKPSVFATPSTSAGSSFSLGFTPPELNSGIFRLGEGQNLLALNSGTTSFDIGTEEGEGFGFGQGLTKGNINTNLETKGISQEGTIALEGKGGTFTLMKPAQTTTEVTEQESILAPVTTIKENGLTYINEPYYEEEQGGMSPFAQSKFLERQSASTNAGLQFAVPKVNTGLGLGGLSVIGGLVNTRSTFKTNNSNILAVSPTSKLTTFNPTARANQIKSIFKFGSSQSNIFKQTNSVIQSQNQPTPFKLGVPTIQTQIQPQKNLLDLSTPTIQQTYQAYETPAPEPNSGIPGGGGFGFGFGLYPPNKKPKKFKLYKKSTSNKFLFGSTPDLTSSTLNIREPNKKLRERFRLQGVFRPL